MPTMVGHVSKLLLFVPKKILLLSLRLEYLTILSYLLSAKICSLFEMLYVFEADGENFSTMEVNQPNLILSYK